MWWSFPANAEQVSEVVKIAAEAKVPLIPRGAGSSVTGAALSPLGGILLDLVRMNKVLEINKKDRYVRVEPGVVCAALNRELGPSHFFPARPRIGPNRNSGRHDIHQRQRHPGRQVRHHQGFRHGAQGGHAGRFPSSRPAPLLPSIPPGSI